MSKASLSTRFRVSLCTLAIRALRLLPQRVMVAFFAVLGRISSYCCRREMRISTQQLRVAFARDGDRSSQRIENLAKQRCPGPREYRYPGDLTALSRQVFGHVGRVVGECLNVARLSRVDPRAPKRASGAPLFCHITDSGEDIVQRIIAEGRGAIGLSAHVGCFELLAAYQVRCGAKLFIIGRIPNYPFLEALLRKVRESYDVETIWREDPRSGWNLLRAIKDGRMIAVLIDQDTNLPSEFAPFFGMDAASPIAPIKLALRYDLPIVSSFIVRTAPGQHHVRTEVIEFDKDDPDAASSILKTFNRRLEALIAEYPEQWIWWHRRWRRRPEIDYGACPEQLRSTTEYLAWLREQEPARRSASAGD